jgi:hypothetical protein
MRSRASRLFVVAVLGQVVVTWSVAGLAQDAPTPPESTASASEGTASASEGTASASEGTASASEGTASASEGTASASEGTASASEGTAASPERNESVDANAPPSDASIRVAVVLVGDPNDAAREAAARLEAAVRETFALPSDDALRASLVGVGEGDLIAPVVRDRRALGGSEREDLPLLGALGDRADVVLLLVVRTRAGSRELVAFDVRHRAFFEGALQLDAGLEDARVVRFVRARGRAALSSQTELPSETAAELEARALGTRTDATLRDAAGGSEPADEPEWIEMNWPYLVAGALLAGAAAFVIVYTTNDSDPVPMLRFRPGGTP